MAATPRWILVKPAPVTWFDRARLLADRQGLAAAFVRRRYRPPRGAYVIGARVVAGVKQPAFQYYSLGDTGFRPSPGFFYPASAVKPAAVVGALWTLGRHGLTGDAYVRVDGPEGRHTGRVSDLYGLALLRSSNAAYDRLVLIAGVRELAEKFYTAARGFPHLTLQRPFTGGTLRVSPRIPYREGARRGRLPARFDRRKTVRCPRPRNCATLFELNDVLRRLVLFDELPATARFPLALADAQRIRTILFRHRNRLSPGIRAALGKDHPSEAYTNVGHYRGHDILENGLIVDKRSGRRYLLAIGFALKYFRRKKWAIMNAFSGLAREVVAALRDSHTEHPPVQLDAGVELGIRIERRVGDARILRTSVTIPARSEIDSLRVYAGIRAYSVGRRGQALGPGPHRFVGAAARPPATHDVVVVRAFRAGKPVAYRSRFVRVAADP